MLASDNVYYLYFNRDGGDKHVILLFSFYKVGFQDEK